MVSLGLSISPGSVVMRGGSYASKVLGTQSASLIAYWPMDESSGTTADNAEGTADRDGTYTGVTLADAAGGTFPTAPYWDGANDYCDVYSASLNTAFDPAEFTISLWAKAEDWDSGTTLIILRADASNIFYISKNNTNDRLEANYTAGGTAVAAAEGSGQTSTNWRHVAVTVSANADEMKLYINGSQVGGTQTGLGTWVGDLASDRTVIGAVITTPANVWLGHLRHVAVWTTPLTAGEIAALATA